MAESAMLCADVVLFRQGGPTTWVLLIKRGREPFAGAWALPGGHVDPGETFLQAAIREAREETGLAIAKMAQVGVYDEPGRDPRGRVVSVAFTATALTAVRPVAGDDAVAVAWVPVSEVFSGELPMAFDHIKIVTDAYRVSVRLPSAV